MEILLECAGLELGNILLQNGYGVPSFPCTASLVSMPRERVRREGLKKERITGHARKVDVDNAVRPYKLYQGPRGSWLMSLQGHSAAPLKTWQLWKDPDDFDEGQCHTLLQKAQKEGSGMADCSASPRCLRRFCSKQIRLESTSKDVRALKGQEGN